MQGFRSTLHTSTEQLAQSRYRKRIRMRKLIVNLRIVERYKILSKSTFSISSVKPPSRVARLPTSRMVLLQKIFENEQEQHHYLRVQKRSIDARAEYFASFPRGFGLARCRQILQRTTTCEEGPRRKLPPEDRSAERETNEQHRCMR